MKKIWCSVFTILGAFALSGCNEDEFFNQSEATTSPSVAPLKSIQISVVANKVHGRSSPTVIVGQKTQYGATGTYEDNSQKDITKNVKWLSSDNDKAKFDANGLLEGLAAGETTVSASLFDIKSNIQVVEVTSAKLETIAVTPDKTSTPLGYTVQMKATGTFTDGTTQDLTSVSWSSMTPGTATVTPNGLVTPVAVGKAVIMATKDGIEATTTSFEVTDAKLESIVVTPDKTSTPLGQTVQMKASGTFTDGKTRDLTGVSWMSTNTDTATVTPDGLVTPVAVGKAVIMATKDGIEATTTSFEVTDAKLETIHVTPNRKSTPFGQTVKMSALGSFSDGSTRPLKGVSWISTDLDTATVSYDGLVEPVAVGWTDIIAMKDGVKAMTTLFEVTDAKLNAIDVTANTDKTPLGQNVQMIAEGTFTDDKKRNLTDVTWISTNLDTATVTTNGLVKPVAAGKTDIIAIKDGVEATMTEFEVTDAELVTIVVTSDSVDMSTPLGQNFEMKALGTFTDDSTHELSDVSWSASEGGVVSVKNMGLVIPAKVGTTEITATKDDVKATVSFEVTDAELDTIEITTNNNIMSTPLGHNLPMTATGIFTDGKKIDLNDVSWRSMSPETAIVDADGLVIPKQVGSTVIKATKDGVEAKTKLLMVTDAVLEEIRITSANELTLLAGQKVQLKAVGKFTDNTTQDLTDVTWTSNSTVTATVNDNGLVTAVETGKVSISVTFDGFEADAELDVQEGKLTDGRIDIFNSGDGTLFTSPPSIAFLNQYGLHYHDISPDGYGLFVKAGNPVPICRKFNNIKLGGRVNWRIPELNELKTLYKSHGNMYSYRKWPVDKNFLTLISSGLNPYILIDLSSSYTQAYDFHINQPEYTGFFVSCVSSPSS